MYRNANDIYLSYFPPPRRRRVVLEFFAFVCVNVEKRKKKKADVFSKYLQPLNIVFPFSIF